MLDQGVMGLVTFVTHIILRFPTGHHVKKAERETCDNEVHLIIILLIKLRQRTLMENS